MLPTYRQVRQGLEHPVELFRNEFGRLLSPMWDWDNGETAVGMYPVDIREDDNAVHVEAEMPGFKQDEINVTLSDGVLHITAERKLETKDKGEVRLTERRFTRVERSFTLPNTVDPNKVTARLEHGVLHLEIAKREEVKPRKIEVK